MAWRLSLEMWSCQLWVCCADQVMLHMDSKQKLEIFATLILQSSPPTLLCHYFGGVVGKIWCACRFSSVDRLVRIQLSRKSHQSLLEFHRVFPI